MQRMLDLKRSNLKTAVLIFAVFFSVMACGTPTLAETWLISVGDSTISVTEAGRAWSELSAEQQEFFIHEDDQKYDFVLSLARKQIIISEILRLDYLHRSDVFALGNSWIRMNASLQARDSVSSEAEKSVTPEDIDFFLDYIGKTVWYTYSSGSSSEISAGPVHLPELPRELAVHLDSMNSGAELPLEDGTMIRLDSVVVTDPDLVTETLEDSAGIASLATDRIASVRGRAELDRITDSILRAIDPHIADEALIDLVSFYSGNAELVPGDTIVVFSTGVITAMDIVMEIEYHSGFSPTKPSEINWLEWFIGNALLNDALRQYFAETYPAAYSELLIERDDWMMAVASDKLFEDEVYRSISVTPDLLLDEFHSLPEIPMIPETRSIQCVQVLRADVSEYERLLAAGSSVEQVVSRCNFWSNLSADDPPTNITYPLLRSEVPGNRGDEVFAMQAEDTLTWSSLTPLFEDYMYFAFRLVDVIPPHEGTYDELEPDLYKIVMARLTAEQTASWLDELSEEYSLEINEDILSTLPTDPELWETCTY